MIVVRYVIDFIPCLVCCQVFFLVFVSVRSSEHDGACTIHDHIVRVHSRYTCATIDRVQLSYTVAVAAWTRIVLGDHTVRADRLWSKSRSEDFWTFQNSTLRLKWLQRPYGNLCEWLRPHWDRTGITVRANCDLMWFGLKIGRSMVAASVWLGYNNFMVLWHKQLSLHWHCWLGSKPGILSPLITYVH